MRNPLDDAIAALRRGDQAKAFTLLRNRLTREPRDALAWLWMSEATPDLHRKMEALQRFVALAPDHPRVPSAQARLRYLESRLQQLPPASRPAPLIQYDDEPPPAPVQPPAGAPAPAEPAPRPRPEERARPAAPPPEPQEPAPVFPQQPPEPEPGATTAPPVGRTTARAAEPTAEILPVSPRATREPEPPAMNAPAAQHVYHPAVPQLLRSLLDTAPMPTIRTDLPGGTVPFLETAPRRAVRPAEHPAEVARAAESFPAAEHLTEPAGQPAPVARPTPWWAWTTLLLMTVQIALLVYIILRIEFLVATVP